MQILNKICLALGIFALIAVGDPTSTIAANVTTPSTGTLQAGYAPTATGPYTITNSGQPNSALLGSIDSVANFRTSTYIPNFNQVTIQGYYGVGTPGGGTFVKQSTSCSDDGGYSLNAVDGSCWKRFGFEKHASLVDYGCTSLLTNCDSQLAALKNAAATLGVRDLYGDNLNFIAQQNVTFATGQSFHCGGQSDAELDYTTTWSTIPAIVLDEHGPNGNITANVPANGTIDCTVMTKKVHDFTTPTVFVDKMTLIRDYGSSSSTIGVTISGAKGGHFIGKILGFHQCLEVTTSPGFQITGTGQCYKAAEFHDVSDVNHTNTFVLKNVLWQNASNNSDTQTIASITTGPLGECEIVTSSPSAAVTGDEARSFNTHTNCDKFYGPITQIDSTHFVLPGTSYSNPTVTANWEDNGRVLHVSDVSNIAKGMTTTVCGSPATVNAVTNNLSTLNDVELTAPVGVGCSNPVPASGVSLTFANPTYVSGGSFAAYATMTAGTGYHVLNVDGFDAYGLFTFTSMVSFDIDHDVNWAKLMFCRDDGFYSTVLMDESVSVRVHGTNSASTQLIACTVKGHGQAMIFEPDLNNASQIIGGTWSNDGDPGGLLQFGGTGRLQLIGPSTKASGTIFVGPSIDQFIMVGGSMPSQSIRLEQKAIATNIHIVASVLSASSDISGLGSITVRGTTCTLSSSCTPTQGQTVKESSSVAQGAGVTNYYPCDGFNSTAISVEGNINQPWALPGTWKNFYFESSSAPGTGNTFVATLRIGNSGTSVTCTISNTSTSCTDTTHTATNTANQHCSIQVVSSASASTSRMITTEEFDPN